jgi:hypothetical protein
MTRWSKVKMIAANIAAVSAGFWAGNALAHMNPITPHLMLLSVASAGLAFWYSQERVS